MIGEIKNVYNTLAGKPERKTPVRRPRHIKLKMSHYMP
jgi:hypothetical protein